MSPYLLDALKQRTEYSAMIEILKERGGGRLQLQDVELISGETNPLWQFVRLTENEEFYAVENGVIRQLQANLFTIGTQLYLLGLTPDLCVRCRTYADLEEWTIFRLNKPMIEEYHRLERMAAAQEIGKLFGFLGGDPRPVSADEEDERVENDKGANPSNSETRLSHQART